MEGKSEIKGLNAALPKNDEIKKCTVSDQQAEGTPKKDLQQGDGEMGVQGNNSEGISNGETEEVQTKKKEKWFKKAGSRNGSKAQKGHKNVSRMEGNQKKSHENLSEGCIKSEKALENMEGDNQSLSRSLSVLEENIGETGPTFVNAFDSRNFKTMEALGIYGLLTPAVTAVPASDQFDTIHTDVKAKLGENWELMLAAAHVDDALKGRGTHGKARSYFKGTFAQRCFKVIDNVWYRRFFLLVIFIHSLAIFIEPPSFDLGSVHFLVFILKAACLGLYIIDLVLRIQFLSWGVFWSNDTEEGYWNGVQFILVCLFWLDFVIICTSVGLKEYLPQPFRCLRLVMLLCRVHTIRHIFEVLAIIGTSLLKVLFIIFIFIITFACIGVHLYIDLYNQSFQKAQNSSESTHCCVNAGSEEITYEGAFNNVGIAILRLFVLLSTENYPEIMLPALRSNSLHFFFFGTFVFFGGFFLTAILLAIVVDSYWIFAKKTIKKERAIERAELAKAWNLLDPLGLGALPVDDKQFIDLFRLLKPKCTDEQIFMLIHLLDSQGDGEIDSFEWTTTLRQALNAEFEEDDSFDEQETKETFFEKFRISARRVAESRLISRVVLCLILVHGVLFSFKWRGQSSTWKNSVHGLRTAITVLFMVEIFVRIAGFGKQIFNRIEALDSVMVFVAFVFNCLHYIDVTKNYFKELCVIISSLAIIIRWLLNSSGPRKAFRWFLDIVPVMLDLVILLFIILYLLSTIAMEIFHKYTLPVANGIYPERCGLGFKNFWCSFLIMFQTLTTSNWHEIMNLTYKETGSAVAYFFFPISYLVITMVVMNLFVAIAIEAANKLTSKRSGSTETLMHHTAIDSLNQKSRTTFHESARKLLTAIARNVVGSAREEETQDRNNRQGKTTQNATGTMLRGSRQGSSTIILASPSKKRGDSQCLDGKFSPKQGVVKPKANENEDDQEKDMEDYSRLSPKSKREKQLKNKMKKKREARQKSRNNSASVLKDIQRQVRAIATFRGSQPTDLDLVVGDTITVIATRDEWMQGECKGSTGWFPASHVVKWGARVLHESRKSKARRDEALFVNQDSDLSQDKTNSLGEKNSSSGITLRKSASSLAPNYRIKMKSGDWRREILGDMTIMNAEEMRELNKVMRAELRAPRGRGSRQNTGFRVPHLPRNSSRRDFIPLIQELSGSTLSNYDLRESTVEDMRTSRSDTIARNFIYDAESPVISRNPTVLANSVSLDKVVSATGKGKAGSNVGTEKRPLHPDKSGSPLKKTQVPTPPVSKKADQKGSKRSVAGVNNNKQFLKVSSPKSQQPQTEVKNNDEADDIPEWAKRFAERKNVSVQSISFPQTASEDSLPGSVGHI